MSQVTLRRFATGFFATACAVFVPRLVGMLNIQSQEEPVTLQWSYVMAGLALALIVGGVVAILQDRQNRPLGDTFMMALGIPGLMAGTFNATLHANAVADVHKLQQVIAETKLNKEGIPKLDTPMPFEPVGKPLQGRNQLGADRLGATLEWLGIASAQAQAQAQAGALSVQSISAQQRQVRQSPLDYNVRESQYLVVLDSAATEAEALSKARQLARSLPNVQVIRVADGYRIVRGAPLPESQAVEQAIELKRSGRSPQLVRTK
jgi:hypothetical protein